MRFWRSFRLKIVSLLRRSQVEADLNDELQDYIEHQTEHYVARGFSPENARLAALRALGNPTLLREEVRAAWNWNWLEPFWRDVSYSMRTLKRAPVFLLIALAVMTLCIGASTSLFTVVRSVLLRPLPFHDPDHLVFICERFSTTAAGRSTCGAISPGDYYDWRAETSGFKDLAAWQWWQFNLSSERDALPEMVTSAAGTWNFFSTLGVQPALGRAFTEAEDISDGNTAMLTWSIFERRFAGDPAVIGREIHLDGKQYTVVGVLPKSFAYPDAKVQIWVPFQSVTPVRRLRDHAYHMTRVVARTQPGVSLANAISQLTAVQKRLHDELPDRAVADGVAPQALTDDLAKDVRIPLVVLMCAVLCMLLIGCLNVANLLVARGAARQKEVAIRGALGAPRRTLIREQLIETALICFGSGVMGILLSLTSTKWMASAWKDLPSAVDVHVDNSVLAFACFLVFVAALIAGLLPAISSTGKGVLAALQASSRSIGGSLSRTRLRQTLLTVEIAVTVVLLVAAGLLLKSFLRLRSTNPGCATDNVLTMFYSLPKQKYETPAKVLAFHDALLDRVRAMPGVRAAGLGQTLPGAGIGEGDIFAVPEHPPRKATEERSHALIRRADPGYFSALQIPLMNGRFFTGRDRLDQAHKAIISRRLAEQYFPGADPLGKHIEIPLWDDTQYEIVGVVGDTLHQVNKPAEATIYLPELSGTFLGGVLVVRTAYNPLAFSIPIQKQFALLDPALPVSDVMTMQQVIGQSLGNPSFSATVVLAFAVLSLILACIGLYGVLSYLMTQRTTELGLRLALGAQREELLRMMLFDGLRPALFGLGFGVAASAVATRTIQSMLYGTRPLDPIVFAVVAATLAGVATLACLVPAWRASRLDPMQALRSE